MIASRMKHGRPISNVCFGTVQLGMPYGIANRTGMPDEGSAADLLIHAAHAGITLLDTARAYGESEARIGKALAHMPAATVMTKLSPLDALSENEPQQAVDAAVEKSLHASLQCLGLPSLPYLLLHRARHLHSHGGRIWRKLQALRQQGIIERLGVSVQDPQEVLDALKVPEVESLQLPFNILDRRYEAAGIPVLLAKRPDVLVVARSALLQGVLIQQPQAWPVLDLKDAQAINALLDGWVVQFDRRNRVDLCLAYVRAQPWIDSVVVGMENREQLEENVSLFNNPPLNEKECGVIHRHALRVDEALLNPARWPK